MQGALEPMPVQFLLEAKEAQTVLADIETFDVVVISRVGTVIPGIRLVLSNLNAMYRFELSCLVVYGNGRSIHALVLRVLVILTLFVLLVGLLLVILVHDALVRLADVVVRHPLIVPPVQLFVMDVVFVGTLVLLSRCIVV